jgi:hypothetical protein
MQNLFIGILFVGLMLVAAGIGAYAAGETRFGMIFGFAGGAVVIISIVLLLIFRKRRAE